MTNMNVEEPVRALTARREHEGRVMVATLSRPPVNALVQSVYSEIMEIVEEVNRDDRVACLLLRAEGRNFCGGADKNEFLTATPEASNVRRPLLRGAVEALHACAVPLVVAVQGAAAGAGALIAACGDIIIASEDAFFVIPEIDLHVVGAAKGLSKIVPYQKARAMALTGSKLFARELAMMGGVEEVIARSGLDARALEVAHCTADKGYLTARKWKEALLINERLGPREGLIVEQMLSQEIISLHGS
jgi:enoyl-CoA hydratase